MTCREADRRGSNGGGRIYDVSLARSALVSRYSVSSEIPRVIDDFESLLLDSPVRLRDGSSAWFEVTRIHICTYPDHSFGGLLDAQQMNHAVRYTISQSSTKLACLQIAADTYHRVYLLRVGINGPDR
ncbi:hypothetical protein TMatcc_009776 [Talaromyces marneffei ATCC 18224]|uniref:uncharacterized protein n=1 Tax=Talaromyces marneffei TaxID=37727 RepID=UPI0012A7A8F1|nr:uncharacterized protein EYB26_009010 [Talaromyces marneffei]QGA21300.1 hypothetical protein EYB26_009010 [Talaromyces marneffei]